MEKQSTVEINKPYPGQVIMVNKYKQPLKKHENMKTFNIFLTYAQFQSNMHAGLEHKLSNVLYALYCENHDSERLMLLVMNILKPLIEKRIKETAINNMYDRTQK